MEGMEASIEKSRDEVETVNEFWNVGDKQKDSCDCEAAVTAIVRIG